MEMLLWMFGIAVIKLIFYYFVVIKVAKLIFKKIENNVLVYWSLMIVFFFLLALPVLWYLLDDTSFINFLLAGTTPTNWH